MRYKILILLLVTVVISSGYITYNRVKIKNGMIEGINKHYGYSRSGYKYDLKSVSSSGLTRNGIIRVTYIPDETNWDIAVINRTGYWEPAFEQLVKDLSDLNEIKYCLKTKIDITPCREAMKVHNIKNPKAYVKPIGD